MALLFMDSFDHYATADLTEKWTTSIAGNGGTVTVNAAAGRRATAGVRLGTGGGSTSPTCAVGKTLAPSDARATIGFSLLLPAGTMGTAGMGMSSVRDGVTAQCTLRVNQDYTLSVVRGAANGTVLGTSTGAPLAAGVVAYVEWSVLIHPSAGTVDVRVNGVLVSGLSLTAQNTRNSAASQWTNLTLGVADTVTNSALVVTKNIDVDDLYVLDGSGAAPLNTFLGDCRVDARFPTAAGATTAWTPTPSPNWDAVNDAAPDDDTTYTATSTLNAVDTFVTQDAPVVGATIYGVQHCLNLKKMDAGVCSVAPVVRHSGVDYPGADVAPGTTYAYGLGIAAVNPGTGAAWTEAGFNAAEFGYKRTA